MDEEVMDNAQVEQEPLEALAINVEDRRVLPRPRSHRYP